MALYKCGCVYIWDDMYTRDKQLTRSTVCS